MQSRLERLHHFRGHGAAHERRNRAIPGTLKKMLRESIMVDKTSTIPELRAYAKKKKINLEGATKKSDILKKIKNMKGGKKGGPWSTFGSRQGTGRLPTYRPVYRDPARRETKQYYVTGRPLTRSSQQTRTSQSRQVVPSTPVQTYRPTTANQFASPPPSQFAHPPPPNQLPIPTINKHPQQRPLTRQWTRQEITDMIS